MQVTGTLVVLDTWSKVSVLLLRHLQRHKSLVLDVILMTLMVHPMQLIQRYVTQTARMCGLLDKEDSVTFCQWSRMIPKATVPVSVLQGTIQHHRRSLSGSMTTLDTTTTTQHLALRSSTAWHSTRHLHNSNSINCSIAVNVLFILLCVALLASFEFVTCRQSLS